MLQLTVEHEIDALLHARREVEQGRPYICALIKEYLRAPTLNVVRDMTSLIDEVVELIDGHVCVEIWLRIDQRSGAVKQFRLAIIDVLLARRGV